ncbi:MAG: hypothetical protein KKB81_05590 [Candidatus Margulisbacteria bacterium]|nr:hypothetical protein [Candidatus Margulisiibacteriota bacterium]MBU1021266.1 hypothetical protein [Candidatus Margulisiibacteriota bacterium]MBU1729245.1 hypothetical protein [Candidatus Margulisiibacteriota bacterium]MBU1954918.1 hypothetical protein [Candidatus Margulisiibacteriota bacterium]
MKKIKHVNHASILKGMGLGAAASICILLMAAIVKTPVSTSEITILLSLPVALGAFVGYTVT